MAKAGLKAKLPSINIRNNKLYVEGFSTDDDDIVAYFSDVPESKVEERFEHALKIGTLALKSIMTAEKIDYIEKSFSILDLKFKNALKETIDKVNKEFDEKFGKDGDLENIIDEHFGEEGKVIKQVFNPNKEGTPLYTLRHEIIDRLNKLAESIASEKERQKVKLVTPLKGRDFEDYCYDALLEIVKREHDLVQKVSVQAGIAIGGRKKGDFVIELASLGKPYKRIAVEAKDIQKISKDGMFKTLDQTLKNRHAQYAILVVKNVEALPKEVGWFNEYNNNVLVCALGSHSQEKDEVMRLEILNIAYVWAKLRVKVEAMKQLKLDTATVINKLDAVKSHLKDLNKILTHCTNIEAETGHIRTVYNGIKNKIAHEIDEILAGIHGEK